MNILKYIKMSAMVGALALTTACDNDDFGPSIFPEVSDEPDPASYTYKFDKWCNENFRDIYNLDFKYKMEDVEADMNYNLVPATYTQARDICLLTKYLWFDAYKEHYLEMNPGKLVDGKPITGAEFLMQYGPRILHLVGSPAYNPNTGTEILGLAEGGLKVTLFKVNEMNVTDINQMNEYYFRTMHHEFGHILHQTISYPVEFNELSTGRYDDSSWQSKAIGYVASLGFITPYASSQAREDFAETIANYFTRSDDAMELIKWMASQGWTTEDADDPDAVDDPSEEKTYYARYYFPDESNPNEKVYFLTSMEKDWTNRPCIIGERGETMYTVAEVEQYLENFAAKRTIYAVDDKDTCDGLAIIERKQQIAREWFKETWGLDFDRLREIVQRRQADFDIDALRAEVEAIPDPVVK